MTETKRALFSLCASIYMYIDVKVEWNSVFVYSCFLPFSLSVECFNWNTHTHNWHLFVHMTHFIRWTVSVESNSGIFVQHGSIQENKCVKHIQLFPYGFYRYKLLFFFILFSSSSSSWLSSVVFDFTLFCVMHTCACSECICVRSSS